MTLDAPWNTVLVVAADAALVKAIGIALGALGRSSRVLSDMSRDLGDQCYLLALVEPDLPNCDGIALARDLLARGAVRRVLFMVDDVDSVSALEASTLGVVTDKLDTWRALCRAARHDA
jgi:hypothetical protein